MTLDRLARCLLLTVLAAAVFVVGLAQVAPAEAAQVAPPATPAQAAAAPTSACPTGFTFNAASGLCEKPADQICPAGSVIFVNGTTLLCVSNTLPVQGVCPPGTRLSVVLQGACEVDPVLTCPVGTLAGTVCQLPVTCPAGTTLTGTTCVEPAAAPAPPAFPGFSFAIGGSPGSTGPNDSGGPTPPASSVAPAPHATAGVASPSGADGDVGDLAEQILDSIFEG